jgi:hypothetical protein
MPYTDCNAGSDLDRMIEHPWSKMPWSITEPGKRASAPMPSGTYGIDVQPDNKTFVLKFTTAAGERICPTRFTAINRACWEAADHHRRLLAQQRQPTRLQPPKW